LFITHDLGVIAETAQHVAVMYAGKVMEYAAVGPLFAQPLHPYTVGLLGSIPKIGSQKHQKRLNTIKGVVPSLFNLPQGCLFSDRCPDVFDRCPQEKPPLYPLEDRQVRCFKYDPGR
jgi:oligopeptide/dipeptide ABC transporter ATP-binding protein